MFYFAQSSKGEFRKLSLGHLQEDAGRSVAAYYLSTLRDTDNEYRALELRNVVHSIESL